MVISCTVNGEKKTLDVPPLKALLDILRDDLGLTGTRGGCRKGICGTCLVLLEGDLVNSCLIPAFRVQNQRITTYEGLLKSRLFANIESIFNESRLSDCKYCSPGIKMAAAALLSKSKNPKAPDIKEAFSANLCACGSFNTLFSTITKMSGVRSR